MTVSIEPLSPYVGARVVGIDLTRPIDSDAAGTLRQALDRYHVLVVRQPDLTEADQARFGEVFGKIEVRTAKQGAKPKEQFVSNTRKDGILGDGEIEFHHDHLFHPQPLTAIALYAIEIPASGSKTEFRNSSVLLDRARNAFDADFEQIRCLHLFNYGGDFTAWQDPAKASPDSPRAWQPLVWTHPHTGQQVFWLCRTSAVDFEGIGREDGYRLIGELVEFANRQTDIVYTHNWQVGDLVIWSNRMVQHRRLPFNAGEPRTLRRTPIV
ncbi:TauD/TfdA dioxygenase family protein [Paraburkholderia sediminicola]|uniref:TauD/TfdA dioxygenase family protein n=1 Tax=Paraburkholderia sediminicola TaxID=458836 RepID=UPI0038B83DB8